MIGFSGAMGFSGALFPSFGVRLSRRSGAVAASLLLALCGCAGDRPPPPRVTVEAPMIAPAVPPSSSEFNVKVAKPLVNPDRPLFEPLPVPASPPPPVAMAPLEAPDKPMLPSMPALAAPAEPPQRGQPIPRPAEPPRDSVSALTASPPAPLRAPISAPPAVLSPGTSWRLVFAGQSADLPGNAADVVGTVAKVMVADDHLRLKLYSYASGAADEPLPARKLSMQRGLKLRAALIERGIASTRVDVLSLGLGIGAEGAGNGPADRIDLIPALTN
ncbi:MAG: hypothetical protein WCF85_03180 [Rhodospirillaceae bacterium]